MWRGSYLHVSIHGQVSVCKYNGLRYDLEIRSVFGSLPTHALVEKFSGELPHALSWLGSPEPPKVIFYNTQS